MTNSFPRNGPGMVLDAVKAALAVSIDFKPFNVLGDNIVNSLFVVHACRGAEKNGDRGDIEHLKQPAIHRVRPCPEMQGHDQALT